MNIILKRILLIKIVFLIGLIYSCKVQSVEGNVWIPVSSSGRFQISDSLGYIGKDTFIIHYYSDSLIKNVGNYAISYDSIVTEYKTGLYTEIYSNGNKKEEGLYQIGKYKNCGHSGLFMEFYNYKIGDWKYWNESGKILAEIEYNTVEKHIQTSCKGGAKMLFNEIDLENSFFYNDNGDTIKPNKKHISKFETISTFPGEFYYYFTYGIDSNNRKEIEHSLIEIYKK